MVRSVILAAGASSRMGQPKAALPIGPGRQTFLSRITSTLIAAGLPEIIVVTGATELTPAEFVSRDGRVRVVENRNWQEGQLSSLLTALDMPARVPIEAALVTLVDVPLVSVETVARLLRTWRATRAPIVRPARPSASSGQGGEEHGHPVIFDASLFDELRRADPAAGAKSVVRAHVAQIVNVPIDDPGAYLDIDTPEQYARSLNYSIPATE